VQRAACFEHEHEQKLTGWVGEWLCRHAAASTLGTLAAKDMQAGWLVGVFADAYM
jgi:hypothetical protein